MMNQNKHWHPEFAQLLRPASRPSTHQDFWGQSMIFRGKVSNGEIVLDDPKALDDCPTLYEQLEDVVGKAQGLPTDLAERHAHDRCAKRLQHGGDQEATR